MTAIPDSRDNVLARLDESKVAALHWKIMFISGMGFFTDDRSSWLSGT